MLLWWRHDGIVSRGLYKTSWGNVLCYPLWLVIGVLSDGSRLGTGIIGPIFISTPLLAAAFSLVLATWSRFAKDGERWTMAASNVLMLILWMISLIMPN